MAASSSSTPPRATNSSSTSVCRWNRAPKSTTAAALPVTSSSPLHNPRPPRPLPYNPRELSTDFPLFPIQTRLRSLIPPSPSWLYPPPCSRGHAPRAPSLRCPRAPCTSPRVPALYPRPVRAEPHPRRVAAPGSTPPCAHTRKPRTNRALPPLRLASGHAPCLTGHALHPHCGPPGQMASLA